MMTASLFMNGSSQAVRLPKEMRFNATEVYAKKIGEVVLLFPKEKAFDTFLEGIDEFTDDYLEAMETRPNDPPVEREIL